MTRCLEIMVIKIKVNFLCYKFMFKDFTHKHIQGQGERFCHLDNNRSS